MGAQRVIAIGLDGAEITLLDRLIDAGELPELGRIRDNSARYLLDHYTDALTGLAWEQFAEGRGLPNASRSSAVVIDPDSYACLQVGTSARTFLDDLQAKVVVFDCPYLDVARCSNVRGVSGWGAHDPGAAYATAPAALADDLDPYPADEWLYGLPWSSAATCREMGHQVAEAVRARARALDRTMADLDDWDLLVVVSGELHGSIEGMWHGVDPTHPLHHHPSAASAEAALLEIHKALDVFVGDLRAEYPEADLVIFNMSGMGINRSDLQSMVLLPELLYRASFGEPLLQVPDEWSSSPGILPPLAEGASWAGTSLEWLPETTTVRAARLPWVPEPLRRPARLVRNALRRRQGSASEGDAHDVALDWMPAARYRHRWSEMRAYAVPSFYDGRIRVNLEGREANGLVPVQEYDQVLDEIEDLLRCCTDPRTGEPAVESFERADLADPRHLADDAVDLIVSWATPATALDHPKHGLIGPVPVRRTGGHTGRYGFAWFQAEDRPPGDWGVRAGVDLAATLAAMVDRCPDGIDGTPIEGVELPG